jgi:hypothetical protein
MGFAHHERAPAGRNSVVPLGRHGISLIASATNSIDSETPLSPSRISGADGA